VAHEKNNLLTTREVLFTSNIPNADFSTSEEYARLKKKQA
jgi:hypothetical protein